MGIVNGTFDTDLSGWILNTGVPEAEVVWDNGRARLSKVGSNRTGGCSAPNMHQKFLIDAPLLSFEWQTSGVVAGGPAIWIWNLVVHGVLLGYDSEGYPIIGDKTIVSESFSDNGSGMRTLDVSKYIGKEATITFYHGYPDCTQSWAYQRLWVDNVIISHNWGILRVSSTPGGASIYVDDAFLNITPESGSIDLTNIAPGPHTVKVTKTDYYDSSTSLTVYPGRIYIISATLNPQVGCLSFASDPVGAKLFLSGRNGQTISDTGFTTFKQICDLFWGDYKWKLLLDGYYPESGTASLNSAAGVTVSKTLGQIGIGCIYFESNPPGAKIIVDGTDTGKFTPDTACSLSLGAHHYELVLAGYLPASGDITLVSTRGEAVSADLVTITAKGSIHFESVPKGAEIFINGIDQGVKTPKTITDVLIGSPAYTLKLDGFKDFTGTVQVLENQTVEVSAPLIPIEGCIYFVTSIPGAKIFVDDVDRGKFTPDLICGLSLGSHTYRLELSGYVAVTGSVSIGAGQGVVVASVLTPLEKGIGAGTILGIALLAGAIGAVIISRRK